MLKGNNPKGWDIWPKKSKWTQNGNLKIERNVSLSESINALLDNGTGNKDFSLPSRCFPPLFKDSTGITNVSRKFLPSTNLGEMCYNALFNGCSSLTQVPDLPATKLSAVCYAYMFRYCSKLNRIKIMYEGTAKDAPIDAFKEWVVGVASNGAFYHKGTNTIYVYIHNFGLPSKLREVKF